MNIIILFIFILGTADKSYFNSSLNKELYFLGLDSLIYIVLLMLIEFGVFSKLWSKINSYYVGLINSSDLVVVEADVAKERDRVDAALHQPAGMVFIVVLILTYFKTV